MDGAGTDKLIVSSNALKDRDIISDQTELSIGSAQTNYTKTYNHTRSFRFGSALLFLLLVLLIWAFPY